MSSVNLSRDGIVKFFLSKFMERGVDINVLVKESREWSRGGAGTMERIRVWPKTAIPSRDCYSMHSWHGRRREGERGRGGERERGEGVDVGSG